MNTPLRIFFKMLCLIGIVGISSPNIVAQTVVHSQDFSATFSVVMNNYFLPNWWSNDVRATTSRTHQESVGYAGKALGVIPSSGFSPIVEVHLDLSDASDASMTFKMRSKANGSGTRTNIINMKYSINGGLSWFGDVHVDTLYNVDGAFQDYTFNFPAATNDQADVRVQLVFDRGEYSGITGTAAKAVIDNVVITANYGPSLKADKPALNNMQYTVLTGGPSAADSVQIIGTSLSPAAGNITLTPPANFAISLDGITFSTSPINIPYTGGTLSSTKVYTRLVAGLSENTYYGPLTMSMGTVTNAVELVGYVYPEARPTNFFPGELFITAFDANVGGGEDQYFLSTLVPIGPGTEFKLVNSRYEAGAAANEVTGKWGGPGSTASAQPGIAKITYTGTDYIPAGSIISFKINGSAPHSFQVNGVSAATFIGELELAMGSTSVSAPNISTGAPDQIFLVQGVYIYSGVTVPEQANYFFKGNVLFGMSLGSDWVPVDVANSGGTANSDRTSRIPPQITCFNIYRATVPAYGYFRNSAVHVGNIRDILSNVKLTADSAYWHFSNTGVNAPEPDFTVNYSSNTYNEACRTYIITKSNPPGTWRGDNDDNWFNCENWEGYAVPNMSTDVYIDAVSNGNNHARISTTAPFAENFDGKAFTQHLTLSYTDRSLIIEGMADTIFVQGDVLIEGTAKLDLKDDNPATADGNMVIIGSWTNNIGDTAVDEGQSTIHFVNNIDSIAIHTIGQETFHNLRLFNNYGIPVAGNISIKGDVWLEKALITMDAGKVFELQHGATITNVSDENFINGRVRKIGNTAFTFPIGKDNVRRPISISAPASITDAFEAEYYHTGPADRDNIASTLDHISMVEYWDVHRAAGSSTVNLTFTWNDDSYVATAEDLRIAHYNGSYWEDLGMSSMNIIEKTITVNDVSSFSPFTLATNTVLQPLPLYLLDFDAAIQPAGNALDWSFNAIAHLDQVEILYSTNGTTFESIYTKNEILQKDAFLHQNVNNGKHFYQLRFVDKSGNMHYSPVQQLNRQSDMNIGVYPNPFSDFIEIKNASGARYSLIGIDGRIIKTGEITNNNFQLSTAILSSGSYNLIITLLENSQSLQLIKK